MCFPSYPPGTPTAGDDDREVERGRRPEEHATAGAPPPALAAAARRARERLRRQSERARPEEPRVVGHRQPLLVDDGHRLGGPAARRLPDAPRLAAQPPQG